MYLWYRILITPYKIIYRDDNKFEFHSILKKMVLNPDDIISIKDSMGELLIIHKLGKIYITAFLDRISDLKSVLRSQRPDIEIVDLANRRFDPKKRD